MTAVKNNSLEELKHKNVIRNYQDYAIAHNNSFDYDVDNYINKMRAFSFATVL